MISEILKSAINEFVMIHTEKFSQPFLGYIKDVDETFVLIEQVRHKQLDLYNKDSLSKPFDIIPVDIITNVHGINPEDLKVAEKKVLERVEEAEVPKQNLSVVEQFDVSDEDQMPSSYVAQIRRDEEAAEERIRQIKSIKDKVD